MQPSPLCIKLPQMNAYAKYYDRSSKYMNILVNDKKIIEKYNKIWNKINSLFKLEFNTEPVYNDNYIKTKIKLYNDKVYANFQYNIIPEDNEYCTCLSAILLDSVLVNSDKEYYPQIFLECKSHIYIKNKKIINKINKDLELSESDDESDGESEY